MLWAGAFALSQGCVNTALPQTTVAQPIPTPALIGSFKDHEIGESSGIVASGKNEGLFWTHNDSANASTIFAVDASGNLAARVTISGAINYDWEDIARDDRGHLIIGDIGSNRPGRANRTLYIIDEPDLSPAAVLADHDTRLRPRSASPVRQVADASESLQVPILRRVVFAFEGDDNNRDCEALFVHGDYAYLLTKEFHGSSLFRVPLNPPGDSVVLAGYLDRWPEARNVTGADITPDGRHVATLSYFGPAIFDLPVPLEETHGPQTDDQGRPLPSVFVVRPRALFVFLGQAEGVTWTGADLLITNEAGSIFRAKGALPAKSDNP